MLVCRTQDESAVESAARCCRFAPFHSCPAACTPVSDRHHGRAGEADRSATAGPGLHQRRRQTTRGPLPPGHCRRDLLRGRQRDQRAGAAGGLPTYSTVFKYFTRREAAGGTELILDTLRIRVRLAEIRVAAPSAAIIDSSALRRAATVGVDTRRYDAGRRSTAGNATSRSTPRVCCCA